jgi:hypothetical protein
MEEKEDQTRAPSERSPMSQIAYRLLFTVLCWIACGDAPGQGQIRAKQRSAHSQASHAGVPNLPVKAPSPWFGTVPR